jgi:hypothetical protein
VCDCFADRPGTRLVRRLRAIDSTSSPAPRPAARTTPPGWRRNCKIQLATLDSIPFQNNTNFNVGPNKDILKVQPVTPTHGNDEWNIITCTILPLIWSPSYQPAQSLRFGLGPTSFSTFLSPKNPVDGWVWGVGPIITELPTITPAHGSNYSGVMRSIPPMYVRNTSGTRMDPSCCW